MPIAPDATQTAAAHANGAAFAGTLGRPLPDPHPVPAARQVSQAEDQVLLQTLRGATVAMVRSDAPDLSARQLGVFLTVYLTEGPHTVRGMAAELNVSKPAITRALDRLGELDLVHRKVDPLDRRSVLAQRTSKGGKFLAQLRPTLHTLAEAATDTPSAKG